MSTGTVSDGGDEEETLRARAVPAFAVCGRLRRHSIILRSIVFMSVRLCAPTPTSRAPRGHYPSTGSPEEREKGGWNKKRGWFGRGTREGSFSQKIKH